MFQEENSHKNRLVPVRLKQFDRKSIAPIMRDRTLMKEILENKSWVDLTDPFSRNREYHRLIRLLAPKSTKSLPDFPVIESDRPLALRDINPLPFDPLEGAKEGMKGCDDAIGRMNHLFCSTIRALASAIDMRNPFTRGHSERVARMAEMI